MDGGKVVIRFESKDYEGIMRQYQEYPTGQMNLAANVSVYSSKDSKECVVTTNSSSVAITRSVLQVLPKPQAHPH